MASEDTADAEMTAQVTALSTKLLEAIDRQADLEDQVQVMRRELDHSRRENMKYEDQLKNGDLVSTSSVALEKMKRIAAEQQVSHLQSEIEELTSSLFDEANKMVAKANRETNDREKRNDQLVQQLKERDMLLENMQEQLTGLKLVLQNMTDQQDDYVPRALEEDDTDEDVDGSIPDNSGNRSVPLATTSVFRPVVRHDLQNYQEFLLMIPPPPASPRTSVIATAVDSSITSGRASPAHMIYGDQIPTTPIGNGPLSASPSLTPGGNNSTISNATSTSNITSLTSRFQNLSTNNNSNPVLKDFKYFKRSVGDDIEPTLHLEAAPGLSWLSRRNIMSSIIDGSIIIEPIAAANEGYKLMVAGTDADESAPPEYIGLSKSISGGSTNTVHPTISNGAASTHSSYMALNQPSVTAYIASSGGNKIKTHLVGGNSVGSPMATRTPCALCGEKRDGSLLYARLHNLRSGNKENKKDSNNNKDSSISTTTHGYHASSDSIGSHASTMNDDKNSIDSNNNNITTTTNNISIDNDVNSMLNGFVPGGFPGHGNSTTTTSSNTVSSGYPLCYYCLNRFRSVCDYVSFIRSIRAGLWKIEDEAGQLRAWEECVKLKERMFWARNGGYFIVGEGGQPLDARTLLSLSGFGGGAVGAGFGVPNMGSRRHTLSRIGSKMGEYRLREDGAAAAGPNTITSLDENEKKKRAEVLAVSEQKVAAEGSSSSSGQVQERSKNQSESESGSASPLEPRQFGSAGVVGTSEEPDNEAAEAEATSASAPASAPTPESFTFSEVEVEVAGGSTDSLGGEEVFEEASSTTPSPI